jgi:hypothetical protein
MSASKQVVLRIDSKDVAVWVQQIGKAYRAHGVYLGRHICGATNYSHSSGAMRRKLRSTTACRRTGSSNWAAKSICRPRRFLLRPRGRKVLLTDRYLTLHKRSRLAFLSES